MDWEIATPFVVVLISLLLVAMGIRKIRKPKTSNKKVLTNKECWARRQKRKEKNKMKLLIAPFELVMVGILWIGFFFIAAVLLAVTFLLGAVSRKNYPGRIIPPH